MKLLDLYDFLSEIIQHNLDEGEDINNFIITDICYDDEKDEIEINIQISYEEEK